MADPTRPPRRLRHSPARRRSAAVLLGTVACSALLASCSFDRDQPATVTLPQRSTTTLPSTLAPGDEPAGSGAAAPEPPTLAWVVQVGGVGDDTFEAVTGAQQQVVAVGSTSSGIDAAAVGGTDVLSATVSTTGELEGTTQFGSTGDDAATGVSATQDRVVACGTTTGLLGLAPGSPGGDAGAGDGWCSSLPDGTVEQLGGSEREFVTGVSFPGDAAPGGDTGLVTGYASGGIDGFFPGAEDPAGRGLGGGDALAFRVGSDGSALWARQFGTPAADAATAVRDAGGDGMFVGWTDGDLEGPSAGGRDGWISWIDSDGVQRWITQMGGTGNDEFLAVDVSGEARRGDERFVAAGWTDGDVDGAGPLANSGGTDAVVTAFATNGSPLWSTQLGGELDDRATAVASDGSTIYVAGTTQAGDGTGDAEDLVGLGELDPQIGPGGLGDVFLAALDAATGEVTWIQRYGSVADERVTAMTTTEDGLLVIAGVTGGQVGDTAPAGGLDAFLMAFPLPTSGGSAASSV